VRPAIQFSKSVITQVPKELVFLFFFSKISFWLYVQGTWNVWPWDRSSVSCQNCLLIYVTPLLKEHT